MIKNRPVDRSDAVNYLKRAEECLHSARRSMENDEWNVCVIDAIHCGIAAADAICVAKLGLRNASENHNDTLRLLASIGNDNEISAAVRHLSSLLSIRTDAEYGSKLQLRPAAEAALMHAERLLNFSRNKVKPI
ncbi:MAG: HEPN domain-containing protein [Candidatus Aenigmatarchaeota archaeon]